VLDKIVKKTSQFWSGSDRPEIHPS